MRRFPAEIAPPLPHPLRPHSNGEWSARRRIEAGNARAALLRVRAKAATGIRSGVRACAARKHIARIQRGLVVLDDRAVRTAGRLDDTVRLQSGAVVREEVHVAHDLAGSDDRVRVDGLHISAARRVQATRWSEVFGRIADAGRIETLNMIDFGQFK